MTFRYFLLEFLSRNVTQCHLHDSIRTLGTISENNRYNFSRTYILEHEGDVTWVKYYHRMTYVQWCGKYRRDRCPGSVERISRGYLYFRASYVPHMWFSSLFFFFSFLFILRYTDIRVESTPAALPNATGVVIDFEHKVCC